MYEKGRDVRLANQSFNRARSFSSTRKGLHLVTISLVSNTCMTMMLAHLKEKIFGKDFDGLETDRQYPGGNQGIS